MSTKAADYGFIDMVRGARPHSSTVALCRHTNWPPRAACASVQGRRLHDCQLRLELAGDEEHTNDAPLYEESRFHRRAKNVSRGHSAITEPAFMGRQRAEAPMHD